MGLFYLIMLSPIIILLLFVIFWTPFVNKIKEEKRKVYESQYELMAKKFYDEKEKRENQKEDI